MMNSVFQMIWRSDALRIKKLEKLEKLACAVGIACVVYGDHCPEAAEPSFFNRRIIILYRRIIEESAFSIEESSIKILSKSPFASCNHPVDAGINWHRERELAPVGDVSCRNRSNTQTDIRGNQVMVGRCRAGFAAREAQKRPRLAGYVVVTDDEVHGGTEATEALYVLQPQAISQKTETRQPQAISQKRPSLCF